MGDKHAEWSAWQRRDAEKAVGFWAALPYDRKISGGTLAMQSDDGKDEEWRHGPQTLDPKTFQAVVRFRGPRFAFALRYTGGFGAMTVRLIDE